MSFKTSKLKMLPILILFLLNNSTLSLTDVTYLNCPSDYTTASVNISRSSKELAKFFYSVYDNADHQAKV